MNRKPDYQMIVTLIGLFVILEATVISGHVKLSTWEFSLVAIAASFSGRAIAYMRIGLPIRFLFVKEEQHPTGVGGYTEPTYNSGWRNAIGELLSCPLCSGTWAGAFFVLLWNLYPDKAYLMVQVIAIGGIAASLSRFHEMLEWIAANSWEQAGLARKKSCPHNDDRILPAVRLRNLED